MPIYEVRQNSLIPVSATSFETERLSERGDIQRLLKEQIECLEEGLMVLAEEFSDWQDSSRRIDLLCLDAEANLVVVELKRTADGGHMELQAIRYAAMVSKMTFDQAVDAHARYRATTIGTIDEDAARREILGFLQWREPIEGSFAQATRIILASADFSKELTTSVMWLRDQDIDIRCVRLKPYRLEDGRVLMDIQQLIPLPEAADFTTQIGVKRLAERQGEAERHQLRRRWWSMLIANPAAHLHAHLSTTPTTWISVTSGVPGLSFNYVVWEDECGAELYIDKGRGNEDANTAIFDLLQAQQEAIEADFHGDGRFPADLLWERLDNRRACRIRVTVPGGIRSPDEEWEQSQARVVDGMNRLHRALMPRLRALSR